VSPLWRDEVGLFIGPRKLVFARMQRGIRPKCVAEQGISIEAANCGDWQPALDAIRRQLNSDLWRNANARIVISDHWTRYAVLPWSAELSGETERMTHARLVLSDTYGDIADEWTVSLSENVPSVATVISAIPTRLLDDLRAVLDEGKLRMISLQPQLIVAYNSWRDKMPDGAAWFACVDEESLAALHHTNGRCDRVRSVRISDDWTVEIRRIQTMGRLAQGRPAEGRVYVDAPIWLRETADERNTALEWLDDDPVPRNIADKVSLLKGLYI
jgi:hypothetical protein